MNIIYVLIPIAMIFVSIAVLVFFWAVKSNQYDDLDREGVNILFDEDVQPSKPMKKTQADIEHSEGKVSKTTPLKISDIKPDAH
ncbi:MULTISPECIES: cbb3-type cytochrome oxidase assembly protein CcoS [Psychromonas]|uniref:Cbb3-type cytochrome oxidase assembly protein CcoS n=1 Tax=Psychromonas arctica TaxID=168275 RepID=A0ABU9HAP5_9GAMM|nr:cbb3-type cytochrome oxidase assembly protein CcoS [Psychromonas sp. SP041]